MRSAALLACLFALAACAHAASPSPDRDGGVDYRCSTDSDCAVKDVGNCCGYYPACVNHASPTFPAQVEAECAKKGMASVCGFPVVRGCACVDGRCREESRGGTQIR